MVLLTLLCYEGHLHLREEWFDLLSFVIPPGGEDDGVRGILRLDLDRLVLGRLPALDPAVRVRLPIGEGHHIVAAPEPDGDACRRLPSQDVSCRAGVTSAHRPPYSPSVVSNT